jgi:uncharacterized membrane protein YdbT with pleckstrin-like domain
MELARFGFVLLILAFYYTQLGYWINNTSLQITAGMFQLVNALI